MGIPLVTLCLPLGLWLAGILLFLSWLAIRRDGKTTLDQILMFSAGASLLWFLGLFFAPDVFGPDYSTLRFRTIFVNIGLMAAGVIVSAFRHRGVRGYLGCLTAILTLLWLYAWAMSSVV